MVNELEWLDRELGRNIRAARERAVPRLTQEDLAGRAGLARTSITNIESGNQQPTLHALWHIAEALAVSPCELLPAWPRSGTPASNTDLPSDVPDGTRAFLERIAATPSRQRR